MKTYLKAFRLKRFWLLLLLPAAFLLAFAARQSADFAEWYAVPIYPVYAQFFSAITGVFPFSVGEFCLIALVLFILAYPIHGVYKLIRHKEGRFAYFVRFLSVPVLIATCIAFLCVTNYGTNHRRYSFAAVSEIILTIEESDTKRTHCAKTCPKTKTVYFSFQTMFFSMQTKQNHHSTAFMIRIPRSTQTANRSPCCSRK